MDVVLVAVLVAVYLCAGRILYFRRWPEGILPAEEGDETLERLRRVGRRRVQPVPRRGGDEG